LRARIIKGQRSEGMPLRQEKLAAELGVSRVSLREAIRQLEADKQAAILDALRARSAPRCVALLSGHVRRAASTLADSASADFTRLFILPSA